MEAFKAFIKPFEAPQKSVKIKFKLIFSFRPGSGIETETVKGNIGTKWIIHFTPMLSFYNPLKTSENL